MTLPYILAGILAVLGQLSDCITTQVALSMGAHEGNPLMVSIVKHFWLECSLKVGVALTAVYYCHKKFAPSKSGTAPIYAIAIGGFGAAIWNLFVITHL